MSLFKRYALAWCIIASMAGIVLLHAAGLFPRPGIYDLCHLVGTSQITLEGRVLDSPTIRWDQTRFLITASAWPLQAFTGRAVVTLAFPDPALAPGDEIRVRGWLYAPRAALHEGDFDERAYWAGRRTFSMLKVWSPESLSVLKVSQPWCLPRAAWTFHNHYRQFWEKVLPAEEASLLLGITVGARGVLPSSIKEACIRAGVYHIVVVSGQNMSLIVMVGITVLLLMQVPKRNAFWICLAPILFYTAVVGADPPVLRAAVMALVGLFVAALRRDIPRYYPLLLAAAWILWREPEALLGASFQLSFGATLGILVIGRDYSKSLTPDTRFWKWMKDGILMGVAVYLAIGPLLLYYFHRLSLAGLVANWTIFPLSGILMVLGLVVGTWGVLAPATVPPVLVRLIGWAVRAMLALIIRMGTWKWSVVNMTAPAWWIIGLYYGFLFGILFLIRRRKTYG